jgi:hypothetical protein
MAGALQTDELGDVLEILTEHELIAARNHRHVAHAEREQFLTAAGIVEYVDRDEIDVFFRKKLFRSEAAASPRLGEQYELVGDCVHVRVYAGWWRVVECRSLLPAASARQARGSRTDCGLPG